MVKILSLVLSLINQTLSLNAKICEFSPRYDNLVNFEFWGHVWYTNDVAETTQSVPKRTK